ncbi:phage protein NinX family protein [Burkholderia stabilis]|uniref:phage protein NinX family protein n=1 Tax=Burkholderia stabilis TaxID=95485 RepID=UPI001F4B9C5F|nr:phage protein NinX family protein [Burkholderia stabilis]
MKVSELNGALLDYWVARAAGYSESNDSLMMHIDGTCRIAWHEDDDPDSLFNPSASWMWGGPIIQKALISVLHGPVDDPRSVGYWTGFIRPSDDDGYDGETPLIAGMRAYVASKFGAEVPDESI